MIAGGHVVIFSTDPEADRIFMRDVLKLTGVDAGRGWLIFGLPPSEIALHPSGKNSDPTLNSAFVVNFIRILHPVLKSNINDGSQE